MIDCEYIALKGCTKTNLFFVPVLLTENEILDILRIAQIGLKKCGKDNSNFYNN